MMRTDHRIVGPRMNATHRCRRRSRYWWQFCRRLLFSDRGSYTLEATLIYPMLFLIMISLVFVSLYMYGQASLYHTASAAAERASFNWDNSRKDWSTGYVAPGVHDGLYWRTGSDGLSGMFALGKDGGVRRIQLPAGSEQAAGSGPEGKLLRAAGGEVEDGTGGELTYRHGLVDRVVTVRLQQTGLLPFFSSRWLSGAMGAEAKAVVTEPAELIRNVDLARTYAPRIKDWISRPKKEQDEVLPAPIRSEPTRLIFHKAEEAAVYVRSITGGRKVELRTPEEEARMADAVDADGLMHEVKLGYIAKSSPVENQIRKDVELMKHNGQIKGVVWHFFRKEKDGKIGPSKPLRRYLEQQGIMVVIHQ